MAYGFPRFTGKILFFQIQDNQEFLFLQQSEDSRNFSFCCNSSSRNQKELWTFSNIISTQCSFPQDRANCVTLQMGELQYLEGKMQKKNQKPKPNKKACFPINTHSFRLTKLVCGKEYQH